MVCIRTGFRVLLGVSVVALACAFGTARPALAQEPDEDVMEAAKAENQAVATPLSQITLDDDTPPLRRKREPPVDLYEAPGIRAGGVILFPTLELGTLASSNVARTGSGAQADAALLLKPGLRLESEWSRHQWTASASGEMLHYLENEEHSSTAAALSSTLRLDVRHTTRATLESGYALTSTGPSDRNVSNSAIENLVSHDLSFAAGVEHDVGAGTFRLRGGVERGIYEDVKLSGGLIEDNDDRNYTQLSLGLRGTFNPGAVVRPFVEAVYEPRVHDRRIDRNGLRRDSHGFSAVAGLVFADDTVWSGEIGASVVVRDYEDGAFKTKAAPGLLANLQWRPTELTTLDLTAEVSLAETTSANDGATTSWTAGVALAHALRDNLDVFGGVTGALSSQSSGQDLTLGTRTGLEWKMNPLFSWSAAYEGTYVFADTVGGDYDEHRLIASIILKR